MNDLDTEARAFLMEFQDQPEEVRVIFIYAICQTMHQAGQLEFMGAFNSPELGTTLLYRNPDSGEVFEIPRPDITREEEMAIQAHIGELLQGNA